MEFLERNNSVVIISDKKEIIFSDDTLTLDGMTINFPGEYEKSGFLLSVMEEGGKLLFSIRVEDHDIAYMSTDTLEITEPIADFFSNTDILILPGTKNAAKIYENLDGRIVIPFGSEKNIFLSTLGQNNVEQVSRYKTKEIDFEGDNTVFVNLGE